MNRRLVANVATHDLLRHLPPELKKRTWETLELILLHPTSGKELNNDLKGCRSYRIGRFRIIYRVIESEVHLITVGPRKTVYQNALAETKRLN